MTWERVDRRRQAPPPEDGPATLPTDETRLRLFVEHAPVALAMFDREMRYLYWSRRWMADYGLPDHDLRGRSHYEVFPEIGDSWKAVHRRALAGEVVRAVEDRFERRDGSVQWLRWEVRPWHDWSGAIGGVVVFSEDITARKVAEIALSESTARYAALVETSPDAILVHEDERVTLVNAAAMRLFGADRPEQLLGRAATDLVVPEYRDQVRERFRALERGEPVGRAIEQVVRFDGRCVDVEAVAAAFEHGGRRMVHVLLHDVTERLALEARLRQSQKLEAIGQLAGGVAHDFNNILTVISGNGELLAQSLAEGPERAWVDQIRESAARAAHLTQQLLAFSRSQVLQPRVVEVNAVVSGVETMLRRLIGEDIQLTCRLAADAGSVSVDPGQLEQSIVNLAVNARDAMPRGGSLEIRTESLHLGAGLEAGLAGLPAGHYVRLSVRDTGTGMTPEVVARAFDPFFTTKPTGRGTGLGLAMVFGFVRQSGGHVDVESDPGRGSTFRIYLPRVGPAEAAPHAPAPSAARRGHETVLLVEDEEGVRGLARRALEMQGYRVLVAESPARALQLVEEAGGPHAIHLLLTDLVLPGASGRELADTLRARHPELRVLLMSGYVEDALTRHGVAGHEAFLHKPFSLASLAAKVREVLDAGA